MTITEFLQKPIIVDTDVGREFIVRMVSVYLCRPASTTTVDPVLIMRRNTMQWNLDILAQLMI